MDDFLISIHIKETLGEEWCTWFDGLKITLDEGGNTLLSGCVPDQSAVRGILVKLWDLNLTVVSFNCKVSKPKEKETT